MRPYIIAVDGPAGAGKSTAARQVAEALQYLYLDTGAMYRALALKALGSGADLRDEGTLARILDESTIQLKNSSDGQTSVWLDGQDVSRDIRSPEVNASVSLVAGFADVRHAMVERQRALAREGAVVMDGRDIGTYVLPEADFKFFLTASLEARARRRQRELAQLGYQVDEALLREEIQHRDTLDSERPVAPLKRASDAIVIDTTDLDVGAVVQLMLDVVKPRGD